MMTWSNTAANRGCCSGVEVGLNWDSSKQGNKSWSAFEKLHDNSSADNDFARRYGQTNAKEDWCTCWEVEFGYDSPGYPTRPSKLLGKKLAAVDAFLNTLG